MIRSVLNFVVTVALVFSLTALPLTGCGSSNGGGVEAESLQEVYERYKATVEGLSGGTAHFYPQEGFTIHPPGAFLGEDRGLIVNKETTGFIVSEETLNQDIYERFRLNISKAQNAELETALSFEAVKAGFNVAGAMDSAAYVSYEFSLTDITLTQITDPEGFVMAHLPTLPNARSLVYGVFTANVNVSYLVENREVSSIGAGGEFLNEVLGVVGGYEEDTTQASETFIGIKSTAPVIIGFLEYPIDGGGRPFVNKPTVNSNGEVTFSWLPVEGADQYVVYRGDQPDIFPEDPGTYHDYAFVDETTFTFPGVKGETYHLGVTSFIAGRQSEISKIEEVTVPLNLPPEVRIIGPGDGEIFTYGERIIFSGEGSDMEDGELGDHALSWFSSHDGVLGTNGVLIIDDLWPGEHVIRLEGTDSENLKGVDAVTITILPGELTGGVMGRATYLGYPEEGLEVKLMFGEFSHMVAATTVTNWNGEYFFYYVPNGEYAVKLFYPPEVGGASVNIVNVNDGMAIADFTSMRTINQLYPAHEEVIPAGSVTYRWEQLPSVASYHIYTLDGETLDVIDQINIGGSYLEYTPPVSFLPGTTYTWGIKGYDSEGVSIGHGTLGGVDFSVAQ